MIHEKNSPKLFFIHGYESSPQAQKAMLLNQTLNATALKYRNGEPHQLVISECLKNISTSIRHEKNVILIGSSLGGFLAAKTALQHSNVKKIILLNPAIPPPSTNLDNHTDVPKKILTDMIDKTLFDKKISAQTIIFRGIHDSVVPDNWVIEFAKAQQATVIFLDDDHRLSNHLTQLPQLIKQHLE